MTTAIRLLGAILAPLCLVSAEEEPGFLAWAERPVMGWNSWDIFGTTVTEAQTREQADFMAEHLLDHGWNLITVDIQWYGPDAAANGNYYDYDTPNDGLTMDGYGRLVPAENRFPSAAGGAGFAPLADYVHAQGLLFGIHIMRGIPRQAVVDDLPVFGSEHSARDIADTSSICPWNPDMYGVDMTKPGAQEYYDSLYAMFASWGVDFVKVDDISRPYGPVHQAEIEAIREAIDKTGRPMVLSLSPGETPLGKGGHVMRHANQWRISDDFWDNWGALYDQFRRLHDWTPYRGAGHFPDADMLPLGMIEAGGSRPLGRPTNFTVEEQRTLMSLWSIARSPLIHGGDLTQTDAYTLSLLTNDEVLAVNQFSEHNRQFSRQGDRVVWIADAEGDDDKYLALFNTGTSATTVPVDLAELGFTGEAQVRSLWDAADLGAHTGVFAPTVAPHGAELYRLSGAVLPTPWLVSASATEDGVTITWEEIAEADSFVVKRATAEEGPFEVVAEGVSGTSFTDTGAQPRSGYYYVVSALLAGQATPDSGARFVITPGIPEAVGWNLDEYGTLGGARVAGIEPMANWNNSWPDNPVTDLVDGSGVPTTVDLSYQSLNQWSVNHPAPGGRFNPGVDADGTYNRELLNGYLNAGGGGSSTLVISQIPHVSYDLIVYFSSDVAGRPGEVSDGTTTYFFTTYGPASVDGENAVFARTTDTAGDAPPAANYAIFEDLGGTEQTIEATIPEYGGVAAFQIVPRPVPLSAVRIGIRRMAGSVELSWPSGLGETELQQSPDLIDWDPVSPQPEAPPAIVPAPDDQAFYRLYRP